MTIVQPRRKNTIWDVDLELRVPKASLAAFDRHKENLLDELRKGCKPESKPFDAIKSWLDVRLFAQLYFSFAEMKQETMPAAARVKRLRQLAGTLGRARCMADKAMQDDVGGDLFRAWLAETNIPLAPTVRMDKDGSSVATRIADKFKTVVASLAALESAARTATVANDVPTKAGRPALLPRDCIQGLARVYRNNTGSKPGRSDGPFARFVSAFLTAVNRPDFEFGYDSVIDAIKDAHSRFKPSWFDEEVLGGKTPPA